MSQLRTRAKQLVECVFVESQHLEIAARTDRRGVGSTLEQSLLTEVVSGAKHVECSVFTVRASFHDTRCSGEDDEQCVGRLSFLHHIGAEWVAAKNEAVGDRFALALGPERED